MALQIIEGWDGLSDDARGAALALGEFDGVHRGHRAVIALAAEAARTLDAPLGVISFDPHPQRWFQPDAEPFQLTTRGQQARALEALGADFLYVIPFNAEMAVMSDEAFARDVLAAGLGARHVAAGFDITFGKDRTGDPDALRRYGEAFGFSVSIAPRLGDAEAAKYSSTAIRQALKAGRPERAAEILGRPFAIEGEVVEGQHLGRTLGFPTANVPAGDYVRPKLGSYATRTRLPDGRQVPGVANFGENPATGRVAARLEVNLFDFDEDLYGQTIETELLAFLRPELNFDSLEALVAQIAEDAANARAFLGL
ncbi:MAG TPA: bifunctional riboflavin kinase/FAD synthetase [Caulobacteraceae bacterium]|nr:bifunctional riboflavin kinase/FAD synthetase [Caulobacteraceae bacterium]